MFQRIRFDDPQILALLAWLGLAGTVLGLALAILFSRRTARPQPAYRVHTSNILQADDTLRKQGIAILYKDQAVSRLTRTIIIFWNAGMAALKNEDVRAEYPIGWMFPASVSVLGVRVLHSTREANHFESYRSAADTNVVLCRFEYLNKGDGALIEILHTGDKSHPTPIGEVLNISPALTYYGPISDVPSDTSERPTFLTNLMLIFGLEGADHPSPSITRRLPKPLVRGLRKLTAIFWRLAFLAAGVGLLIFASNTDAVYNYTCSPPPGETADQCRTNIQSLQWLYGIIGATILLAWLVTLLRRNRRYPSALDPRDLL